MYLDLALIPNHYLLYYALCLCFYLPKHRDIWNVIYSLM